MLQSFIKRIWGGYYMSCRETRKHIDQFIKDELEGRELWDFIKHIMECPECMEELEIQYLVSEGIQHLEKGSTFDLQGQLDKKIEKAEKKIRARKWVIAFMYVIEVIAILAVILMTILVILK